MDKLERAIEEIKRGGKPEQIARKYGLSSDEKNMLDMAFLLRSLPKERLSAKDKKRIWISIRSGLPDFQLLKPSLRKRLVLAFVSILVLSSAVIASASSTSTPESPLYPIKEAYSTVVSRIFKGTPIHKKILIKEIKEYENALKNPEIKHTSVERKIREKLEFKKRELIMINTMNNAKKGNIKRQEIRKNIQKQTMPPKKEPDRKIRESTIPPLNEGNQEGYELRMRRPESEEQGRK
jgi:hypothetical protein